MTHKLHLLAILAATMAATAQSALSQHLVITHGATLGTGSNWAGFSSMLVPDVNGSAPSSELNGTYNIYLTNESNGAGNCPATYATPLPSSCSSSKTQAEAETEREAIMSWFGFALTGRQISIAPGDDAPEYALVDAAQNRRAISDPGGWRTRVARQSATPASWSLVKRVYR